MLFFIDFCCIIVLKDDMCFFGGFVMRSGSNALVVTPSGSPVGLYRNCSVSSGLLKNVPNHSKVKVISDDGYWANVSVDTKTGYMMTVFLVPDGIDEFGSVCELEKTNFVFDYYKMPLEKQVKWLENRVQELETQLAKYTRGGDFK